MDFYIYEYLYLIYSLSLSEAHCSKRGVKITSVKRKKTLQVSFYMAVSFTCTIYFWLFGLVLEILGALYKFKFHT